MRYFFDVYNTPKFSTTFICWPIILFFSILSKHKALLYNKDIIFKHSTIDLIANSLALLFMAMIDINRNN